MIDQASLLWSVKSEISDIFLSYTCLGFGNSNQSSQPNQSPLLGDDKIYKQAETSYEEENGFVSITWASPLIYGDLWNSTVGEIAVVKNCTSGRDDGLLRITLNPPISLNQSDIFKFYITVRL